MPVTDASEFEGGITSSQGSENVKDNLKMKLIKKMQILFIFQNFWEICRKSSPVNSFKIKNHPIFIPFDLFDTPFN